MDKRVFGMTLRGFATILAIIVALVGSISAAAASRPATYAVHPAAASPALTPTADRPNIILITSDDQAADDLKYMPFTKRLLGKQGVTYDNYISPHPLCCPARAEMLSGQYGQNNGVHHNYGIWGGWSAYKNPSANIGAWLQRAGYQTAFTGKFLNRYYGNGPRVPGWDIFDPTIRRAYAPYGLTMNNNYEPKTFPDTYTADLINQRTLGFIKRFSKSNKPFFIYSSQIAPHGMMNRGRWVPPVPAKRHAKMFRGIRPPAMNRPSWREKNLSDKYQKYRKGSPKTNAQMVRLFQRRIQSLQSVDEAVRDTVRLLRRLGELDDTVIIFTSDNGWVNGEHNYVGKTPPWEESLRIPFVARGPGIPKNVHRKQTMTLVDLAPTILELGRATATVPQDGRSMMSTMRSARAKGYDTNLIQSGDTKAPWEYRGVRTGRYTYAKFANGFVELYDRKVDPYQMRSVAGHPRYALVERELARRTRLLSGCSGAACYRDFRRAPKPLSAKRAAAMTPSKSTASTREAKVAQNRAARAAKNARAKARALRAARGVVRRAARAFHEAQRPQDRLRKRRELRVARAELEEAARTAKIAKRRAVRLANRAKRLS